MIGSGSSSRQLGCALLAALGVAACATNPATGERQISLIGEGQEIEMGRAAHQDVAASIGFYEDAELQRMVERVGERLAAVSERPDLPWTFRVVDDPSVNAFAIPGGFIYVTRGLLATLGSEAEMAAVLAHEIGHVTGRHAIERISKAQLFNLGLGVGMIVSPELRQFGDLAGLGLDLLFLKYSRDDERQSDDLGLRYMVAAGYDPDAMPDVFALLERAAELSGGGRVPDWLATHPNPEARAERAADAVSALPAAAREGIVDRQPYLRRLDGVVYGPDPRQGYFRESTFIHPELRFRIDFPTGWQTINQRTRVAAGSPQGDAVIVLSFAREAGADAAARAFASQGNVRTSGIGRVSVHGLPAAALEFEALVQQDLVVRGAALFVEHGGAVYRILGYAPRERWRAHASTIERALESFARVTDRSLLSVEPKRVEIVSLPEPMTFAEFARRYPSTVPQTTVALVNDLAEPATRLEAGRLMKRIVGGT